MKSTRSVAIYCEFGDGKAIPKGTGVEIFEGVFFTAKHTIYKKNERGDKLRASSISVARCTDTIRVDSNHSSCLNIYEHPDYDFAIIETDAFNSEKIGPSYFEIPNEESAGRLDDCELFGFPEIADKEGIPTLTSLGANCRGAMPGSVFYFDATLPLAETWLVGKKPQQIDAALRGFSGAGIIRKNKIIGIFLGKKIPQGNYEALCLGWLNKNDDWFKRRIAWYRNAPVKNEEIELTLREIRERLRIDIKIPVYPNSTQELETTLLHLWEHLECIEDYNEKLMKISALAKMIFCWYFARQIALDNSAVKISEDGKWSFPTRHWCGVEAFMAGLEGRRLELRATNKAYDPAGKKNLSVPPPRSYSRHDPDKHHEITGQLWLDLKKPISATELSMAISDQLDKKIGGVATDSSSADEKLRDILTNLRLFHSKKKYHFSFGEHNGAIKSSIDEAVSDYAGLVPAIQMQGNSSFADNISSSVQILAQIMQKSWGGERSK